MRTKVQYHKINVVTLGCSKNLVDSEVLMKQLVANQIDVVHNSNNTDAKTVIINTCGFINDAKQESIDTILNFAHAKKKGIIDNLFVMGCLSERYKMELKKEIEEVDEFFGVNNITDIVKYLGIDYKKELLGERLLTTPKHYAFLKISEGCNKHCAFCAIPRIRGKHVSRPIDEIISEAHFLAQNGVKELLLIAQDLSYYGLDLYNEQMLPRLLTQLSDIKEFEWIRLHYAYPLHFPTQIIDIMQDRKNICKYIDIPFQHISDNMLTIMKRSYTKKWTLELIEMLRQRISNIGIRTTLLVGHPGETEDDFEQLKQFVSDMRFERLGVFTYSHEEDTHTFKKYKDEIPLKVKQQRADEIMEIQREISLEINQNKVGKTITVLIDERHEDYYIGRTEQDSPEVDNEVLIEAKDLTLNIGQFYNVQIDSVSEYDLYGRVI